MVANLGRDIAFQQSGDQVKIRYREPSSSSASDTDTLSVTSKSSSENDFYSGTLKRFRKEEEALQGPQAKNLIKTGSADQTRMK
ncbi:hypothetical protein KUCAC02_022539 [Chaenocephalus aceratus]|uniref:Uncharacterized protein n=1 Tax=Chaenocephalus aceratus TaxID=36190 RepID=A0ACB9XNA4_CHAAC|nr:hypothetical protein KUCAC02_022539 [Chaenocephalus aceratus]